MLFRATVADDRTLDLGRCVFGDRQPGFDGCQHRDASGMTQLERAPGIGCVKEVFDGHTIGPALREEDGQRGVNLQ